MSEFIPQAGDRIRLQEGHELIDHERGVTSLHTMFIIHCEDILYKLLGDKRPLALHLFMKLAMSLKPRAADNIAPLHIPSLMDHFGTSQRSIYDAMRVLRETDLMRKVSKGHYWLNPYVVWCGEHKRRIEDIQSWERQSVKKKGANNEY